jgi:imidazolonepropionase-like amidohydrolase
MRKLLSFSFLLFSSLLQGQSHKTLILTGKLFDSQTGEFLTGKAIIVDNNKIKAVIDEKEISEGAKRDYEVIDLSNFAVLPGLIDAHTHLLNKESLIPGNEFAGLDMMKTLTMKGDAYRAIYGSVRAKAYLEAGITAVQDLGNSGQFADIALRKAITEGLVIGPRMRCAGLGLASEGGQMPDVIYKHRDIINDEYRIVVGRDDAIQAVRENITQGSDVIKIYSNNTPNKTALSVEEMQAIVKEAHRYGIRVTAHATDNQAVYNAVISGVDGIEHGYEVADSTLELMANKGVVLVPTDGDSLTFILYVRQASPGNKNAENGVLQYRKYLGNRLQRAIKKGVIIVAGSDDYIDFKIPFAEPSKRTLIGYVESGMSIPEVLKAATINASRQLNWSNSIGIIKAGYLADLIAVDKNLDKNIQAILNVHFVMKDGKIYLNNDH